MLNRFLGDLRIVVIQSPYDTFTLPLAQSLFSQCAAAKIESYRSVYPYGVLPVDSYDFIATHHLLCREKDGQFKILMAFKTITLEKCKTHRLPFPAVSLLRSSGADLHAQTVENFLAAHEQAPEKVSYGGSWTAVPEARENPVLQPILKELFIAMLVQHERELGTTERFCYGVLKVKTDQFFEKYGYVPIVAGNGALPPFHSNALCGEQGVILRAEAFSDEAERLAKHYEFLWEERLQIDSASVAKELKNVEQEYETIRELKKKVAA